MWFKQAASSVWNATKNILQDSRTPVHRLLDEVVDSEEEIIPTNKLNELSTLTYDIDSFMEIVDLVIERIRVFKYDLNEARRNLNMLITINYLIKHGATAFVDELREYIPTFKKYQTLSELKTYDDPKLQNSLNYELEKIKSRAQHIQMLLEDKQKLLREKELSMLVKQKLKLYQKEKLSEIKVSPSKLGEKKEGGGGKEQAELQQRMGKMESMMEKYLWQYVDKLDGKIEEISEKVLNQVDKYVLGEVPEKFQLEDSPEKEKSEEGNYQSLENDNDDELMKRLEAEIQEGEGTNNSNLLDFEEVLDQPADNKGPEHAELI